MKYHCTFDESKRIDGADGHWSYPMLSEENGCTYECMSGVSCYANTEFIPAAVHDFQEGFLVLEGNGVACVGNQIFPIDPLTSFIVPKETEHTMKSNSDQIPLKLFWFHAFG